MKLDLTEDCFLVMGGEPSADCLMVITALLVALSQAPASVLTTLTRDLQHLIAGYDNQIVFRLIRAILNRNIISVPVENCGGVCFCSNTDMLV